MSAQEVAPNRLESITGCLLAQVDAKDALAMRAAADDRSGGMVVTGNDAMTVVKHLRNIGYAAPLLADRQRYSGAKRLNGSHPFDPSWIAQQQRLGLPVIIPDAGYIPAGDLDALRSVLDRSATIQDGAALLALATWWIHSAGLEQLLAELKAYSAPVALVLEHKGDPYESARNLRGVLDLLAAGTTLLPLRSDQSALGLLAFGATAAGVGARSGLRHLYPPGKGWGPGDTTEGTFWSAGLSFHQSSHLYDAVSASPTDPAWSCTCRICNGARLDRFDSSTTYEIREHNHACLRSLRDLLVAEPSEVRPGRWIQMCRAAAKAHISVATGPVSLRTPKALLNWLTL